MAAARGVSWLRSGSLTLILALACWSQTALAGPADCDAALSEQQKTVRQFCETFKPCAMVYAIFDKCSAATQWLDELHLNPGDKAVTPGDVSGALNAMHVSELDKLVEAPNASHCSYAFDVEKCRQYLGQAPIPVADDSAKAPPRPADTERRAKVLALYKEAQNAGNRSEGPFASVTLRLENCAASKQFSSRDQVCGDAQKEVDSCVAYRSQWAGRRVSVLAEIDQAQPGVGQAYTPGISPLRGLGPQADGPQQWNDTVRGLRSLEMPACPSTLPNSSLTPAQALAEWSGIRAPVAGDVPLQAGEAPAVPGAVLKRNTDSAASALFNEVVNQAEAEGRQNDAAAAVAEQERQRQAALAAAEAKRQREQQALAAAAAATAVREGTRTDAAAARQSAGESCHDLILDVARPIIAADPFGDQGDRRAGTPGFNALQQQEEGVWSFRRYEQVLNSAPGCANDSDSRTNILSDLQRKQRACEQYRQGQAADCVNGQYYGNNQAEVEAALRVAMRGGSGGQQVAASGAGGGASTCTAGMDRIGTEINSINARNPGTGALIPSMQIALYELDMAMKFLDSTCRGQSEYSQYAGFKQQYESMQTACRASASSPGDCVPKLAW